MRIPIGCLLLLSVPAICQHPAAIEIRGEVEHAATITASELAAKPRVTVRATAHNQTNTFEGVSVFSLLKAASVPSGEALRGKNMSLYLAVDARDGYQAIFSLAELDPAFTDKIVLIADRKDGKALPVEEGPFRIIVPDEKRPARWVRQVTALTILRSPQSK